MIKRVLKNLIIENWSIRVPDYITAMYLLLLFLSTSESCDFLKNSFSLGVTPDYVPQDYAVIVYDKGRFLAQSYMIKHESLNDTLNILKVHMEHPKFRKDSVFCVETFEVDLALFESFWSFGVANVVQKTHSGSFIYNPFNQNVVLLNGNLRNALNKIWTDLHGYKVTISVFRNKLSFWKIETGYGSDGSFLSEISKRMNFTPEIVKGIDYDYLIHQLERGKAEFGGISHFLRYYGEKIEMSNVLYGDDVCTVLKKAGMLRGWDIFLSAFHWQVWAFITITALMTNLILTLICPDLTWKRWLPVTLRSMFMIPTGRPPKGIKERFIIGGCLLWGVVIVTTYQASLYKFIHDKTRYQNPERLNEVRKPITELDIEDQLLEHYAVKARKREVEFLVKIGTLTSEVHIVPECHSSYNLGFPFPYGSSYLKPISRFVQQIIENGLHKAWYRKTIFNMKKIKPEKMDQRVRSLNLNDFEVAFFSLVLGLTISFATFILEVISSLFKTRFFLIFKKHLDPYPYVN